jgi:hypothetical protein
MTTVPEPEIDDALLREMFAAQGVSFRGGAVANLESAPMGKGHGNANLPFDIETACYLKPIFAEYDRAIANGTRLFLVLKAGVKTMKSFTGEVCCADHVCNRTGDAAIFFGSENAAETTGTTRILDYYRGIPRFKRKLETMRSRFDETMGALKFPDKTLFILSANLGNTQQKNLGGLFVQDAFVTEATGMIDEALARTTQYEKECIIFLESQGGEKGFDFDRKYDETDQRELHVNCPCCGSQHIFNWKVYDPAHMTRADDFVARLPKSKVQSLKSAVEVAEAVAELTVQLRGKGAGFKRGPEELIKSDTGDYNEAAILRETHFECYHCGGLWRDDGEFGPTRIALDQSAGKPENYVPARLDALPGNVGFNVPQWINRRLSWGKMMLEKVLAERTAEAGNDEPLKKWWQKTAARTWEGNVGKVMFAPVMATVDPLLAIPNELFRDMRVDCQKDMQLSALNPDVKEGMTGHFWVVAAATDKAGNETQLWRGYCTSWEEWIAKYRELKIPVVNVSVDGGFKPGEVLKEAARHAELLDEIVLDAAGKPRQTGRKFYGTWTMMRGDDAHSFRWPDGYRRIYSPTERESVPVERNGRTIAIDVNVIRWSNFRVKNELDGILRGEPGKPKLTVLPLSAADPKDATKFLLSPVTRAKERPAPNNQFTWEEQMRSERLGFENAGKFAKPKWLPIHKQQHYRDCQCMGIVKKLQFGLLGAMAAPEEAAKPASE